MHKSWKNTKYIFWLQKVVKIWIWWHFQIRDPKFVYISFLTFSFGENFFLGRKSWFSRTFRRILCGMRLQKGVNFEKLYIFCKLETLFNLCFAVNYCFQASCKDLHWKTDFSLPFYAESWKMRKIQFLVTKSGQILNLMSGKVPRPQICGGFHLSESSSDGWNIPLEGDGGTALPPPSRDLWTIP